MTMMIHDCSPAPCADCAHERLPPADALTRAEARFVAADGALTRAVDALPYVRAALFAAEHAHASRRAEALRELERARRAGRFDARVSAELLAATAARRELRDASDILAPLTEPADLFASPAVPVSHARKRKAHATRPQRTRPGCR
jgi:hypothetical protein